MKGIANSVSEVKCQADMLGAEAEMSCLLVTRLLCASVCGRVTGAAGLSPRGAELEFVLMRGLELSR